MAILGSHALHLHSPFCDYLNITVPHELATEVRFSCAPLLSQLGATQVTPDLWQVPPLKRDPTGRPSVDLSALAHEKPGTVTFKRMGQVLQVSSSGSTLRSMRIDGSFVHWLSVLSSWPHRVTRADAAVDLPSPAPPLVQALYAAVRRDGIRLGRKRTPPANCRAILRAAHYDESRETGTVYIGSYGKGEITFRGYDKRNEVLDRGGSDPGDCFRAEFSFSGQVGCTLRDVADPSGLFWHYSSELLDPPPEFTAWTKGDTGFHLDKLPPLDPVVAITRACERNEGLRTVIRFSDKLGFPRRHLWGYMDQAHPLGVQA